MTPPSARARSLLAAVAGALLVPAFPPFNLWPLAVVATALLCWLLSWPGPVPREGAQAGFWFGMTFFAGSVYWVVPVMRHYGGLPWIVALSVLLLFTALLAAFFAGFAALVQHLVNRMGAAPALILAPAVWVAAELARNHLLTGRVSRALAAIRSSSPRAPAGRGRSTRAAAEVAIRYIESSGAAGRPTGPVGPGGQGYGP